MADLHLGDEATIRTRIRKFRDEGSHPNKRLAEAAELVDLVERILNMTELVVEDPGDPATVVQEAKATAEVTEPELEVPKPGLIKKIFG